jgi:hypothetical protein
LCLSVELLPDRIEEARAARPEIRSRALMHARSKPQTARLT